MEGDVKHKTVASRPPPVNPDWEDSDVYATCSGGILTLRLGVLLCACLFAAGCASDGGTGPDPVPPQITVTGVEAGGRYDAGVTIGIQVDRGSYEATLNGQPFTSGRTVATPGEYTLLVSARAGTATNTLSVAFTITGPSGGTLIIRMFNLGPNEMGGGGDAILLSDSSAAGLVHALIDAGPAGVEGADPGYVSRQLATLGVDSLAVLLLTHAHADHFGGMPAVIAATRIGTFVYNGQVRNLAAYNSTVSQARAAAATTIVPTDTVPLAFGRSQVAARLTIVPPLPTWLTNASATSTQLNEGSVGAHLQRGTFRMFFTGDGEVEANNRWRTQFAGYTRDLTVLKVGHHGANNAIFDNGFSGTSTWLQHTAPRVSIISSNGITHPRVNALTRLLQQSNNRTYCTSVHGRIEIRVFSNSTHAVSVERNSGSDCVPGSEANT